MNTDCRKSNMLRLLHHCLIVVCLAGSLMLLPLCCGGLKTLEYEYDSTPVPDYDYNATFDYSFFSNSSNEALEYFIREKESEDENGGLDRSQTDRAVPTPANKIVLECPHRYY
ncbi:uncharacterized protein si:ch211-191i18.2 isoform X2 [Ictalurus punctatus]|uniref:Uncharacterized protein si:ch211-191i18.2 isoform X2 n=1 Tax=Ictalurus punctatus TaxID=7998 RepID=A0A2D0PZV0_ICTPU|nr:uncharacterized protein si:ch211-191i18.2 isoform X2 [Ictalurus punctatus]